MKPETTPLDLLLSDLGREESATAALDLFLKLPPDQRSHLLEESEALREALVRPLAHPRRTLQRRAAGALVALLPKSPALEARLLLALTNSDQRLRWGAAWTLGQGENPPAAIWPAVREAMALDDGDQRWAASRLACKLAFENPGIALALDEAAGSAPAVLRKMALYCLRDLGTPGAATVARRALRDDDSGVRLAALAVLARLGDPAHASAVAECLEHDPEPGIRRAAAATLGRFGPAAGEVRAILLRVTEGAEPALRRAARLALGLAP